MIPLTVLVVEPDASRADRIARAVVAAGHAPVILADGERAIDRFVQEPADVVICEYFLPGRDGATTVDSIRWAPGGRQVHAILLAQEEPEVAPLATIGARIDAVATFVGEPPLPTLTEILRSLDRKPPNDPRGRSIPGELPPAAASWLDRTTNIVKGMDANAALFGQEESTLRGSAAIARMLVENAKRKEANDARTKETPLPDAPPSRPVVAPKGEDGTRVAKRRGEAQPEIDPAARAEGQGVRDAARKSVAAADVVEGRFESTAFPTLLARLAEARVVGGLICTAEDEPRETVNGDAPTKIVYFRAGVPVHVRSNLVDECLGQLLLRKKRIGAATLDESVRRMELGHGLQGEILIDMGALSPLEVSETLAEQAREKLFDLFGWRRGHFRLMSTEPPKEAIGVELALPEMVYEGICAAMPATRLLDLLTPMLDRYVVPDPQKLARFVRVRLPVELKAILARVDGSATLRLLLAMGTKPGSVAQLVYAMECLGAVRLEEGPRKRLSEPPAAIPSSQPASRSASKSAVPAKGVGAAWTPAPSGLPSTPGILVPSLQPAVFPQAAPAPSPARSPSQLTPAPAPAPAKPITGARPMPAGLRPSNAESDASWEDPTTPRRMDEAIADRDTPFDAVEVEPPRVERMPVSRMPIAPISMAAAPPPQPVAPPQPQATPIATTSSTSIPIAAPLLDAEVDRLFEAERHFRRGNRALERERWSEALTAFEQAIALCPNEGEFVAYVGWARHCTAPDAREATERALSELDRALVLTPDLFVVNLLRARVLGHAGRHEDALRAFQRVLVLEPSSEEARVAISRLSQR
jgi:CheY-like chemotaxis protein